MSVLGRIQPSGSPSQPSYDQGHLEDVLVLIRCVRAGDHDRELHLEVCQSLRYILDATVQNFRATFRRRSCDQLPRPLYVERFPELIVQGLHRAGASS